MDKSNRQPIYVDINKAVSICGKCKKFKKIAPKITDVPVFFCTEINEKFNFNNEKYLPCIAENISQTCMANFIIKNIKISELILWSFN